VHLPDVLDRFQPVPFVRGKPGLLEALLGDVVDVLGFGAAEVATPGQRTEGENAGGSEEGPSRG